MKIGKDRKIELQQKIINELQEENKRITEENEELKEQLEFEKIKPREGYEETKELIVQLEKSKEEYEELIVGLKEKQRICDNQLVALKGLKVEYKKRMGELIKEFSKVKK